MIEIQHKNFREVLKFSLPFTTFVRLEEAWKDWTPRWTFPVPRYNWLFFKCQDAIILWIQRPHSHRSFHVSPIFLCPFSSGCQMPMDKSTTGSLPGRHGSTEPQGACCARNPEASRWCGMCPLHFDPFWSKNNIHSIYIVYHNRLKSILLKSPTLQDPAAVLSASTGAQG